MIIEVEGDLEENGAAQVIQLIGRLVEAGHTRMALDLTLVGRIDAAGLRLVLAAANHHRTGGIDIVLAAAPDRLCELCARADLEHLITF
jgi:anti-anti-sigma factor